VTVSAPLEGARRAMARLSLICVTSARRSGVAKAEVRSPRDDEDSPVVPIISTVREATDGRRSSGRGMTRVRSVHSPDGCWNQTTFVLHREGRSMGGERTPSHHEHLHRSDKLLDRKKVRG